MIRVGSLFSGIGGLDVGIERVFGESLAWNCEVDPFCCALLQRRWPDVPNIGDVRAVDWQAARDIDLLCAGFPCQPASVAGKRRGVEDERWLWGEVARALRVLRPRLALLENVPGLLTVDGGRAFGIVLADLAELGYAARWTCLRASDLGAPHRRNRLFVLAISEHDGSLEAALIRGAGKQSAPRSAGWDAPADDREPVRPVGDDPRFGRREGRPESAGQERQAGAARAGAALLPAPLPAQGGTWAAGVVVRGYDATDRLVEPAIRPLADGLPGRVARLRALGNAVVPDQAEYAAALLKEVAQT